MQFVPALRRSPDLREGGLLNDNECADGEVCLHRQCTAGDDFCGPNAHICGLYACDMSTRKCRTSCTREWLRRFGRRLQGSAVHASCNDDRDCATGYVCHTFECHLWDGG